MLPIYIMPAILLADLSVWLGVAISCISVFIMFIWFFRLKNRRGKSDPVDIFMNPTDMVILSNVYHSGGDGDPYREGRIVYLDKNTGSLKGRQILGDRIYGGNVFGHLIVVNCDKGFVVIDQDKRGLIFTTKILLNNTPVLKEEGIYSIDFKEDSQTFFIKSKKDKQTTVTLTSLTEKPIEEVAKTKKSDDGRFVLNGSNKIQYKGKALQPEVDILNPQKLMDTEEFCILLNREDITEKGDFSIVKLGSDGKIHWTIQRSAIYRFFPENFNILFNKSDGTDLFIGIAANWSRMVCIDTVSGKVKWNYRI